MRSCWVTGVCLVFLVGCGECGHASEPEDPRPRKGGREQTVSGSGAGDPTSRHDGEHDDPARVVADPLVLGAAHGCILAERGVRCWGSNRFAQLGQAGPEPGPQAHHTEPLEVPGLDGVGDLAAGSWHTCASDDAGKVWCWGHNGFGQLGRAPGDDRREAVQVRGVEHVVDLAAGEGHSCAVTRAGRVECWGRNQLGQLGDGTRTSRPEPKPVAGLTSIRQLAAGRGHTCARDAEGAVWCWGVGVDGQLGTGDRPQARTRPQQVELPAAATHLEAGGVHTCAVLETAEVMCWGGNDSGQLGDGRGGEPEDVASTPVRMKGVEGAEDLALGGRHTCVYTSSTGVQCAGFNHYGQVGDGTHSLRTQAVEVQHQFEDPGDLSAGAYATCILDKGDRRCWGRNHRGQLGDGTTEDRSKPLRSAE